jgi:Tol biopolymer transport system component
MFRLWLRSNALLAAALLIVGCSSSDRAGICVGEPDLDLWLSDTSGNVTRLVGENGADGFADWSPDGERIVFVASRDGNCEIYVVSVDGSDQFNLTNSRADELYPSWSPDGSQIVYVADGQLHVLDASTGKTAQLTSSDLIHAYPDWSPDGEAIVFSGGTEPAGPGVEHQIYAVPASGGSERRLTDGDSLLVAPKWSPDGSKIGYFDHGDPFQISVMNFETGVGQRIIEGGHFAWAPDSVSVVHDREVGPGDVDIFVDGKLLVDGPGVDTLPAWSPDGGSVVFSSDRP